MDAGWGGVSMLDGKVMKQTKKDVYRYGKLNTKLFDFCATLESGNHILEVYGAEPCCDGTTRWTFQVNGGKWEKMTIYNLNKYMAQKAIEGDTIVEYGDVTVDQKNRAQWHEVKIQGVFNKPIVIMGTPSFNGGHPLTLRVKDVTRTSFKWQMQEYVYLDGPHTKETISYMIVEEGYHQLYDGTKIAAGSAIFSSNYKSIKYQRKFFSKAPVVFTQITTELAHQPMTTRVRTTTNRYFRAVLKAEEKRRVRNKEEVSWVAWSESKDKTTLW